MRFSTGSRRWSECEHGSHSNRTSSSGHPRCASPSTVHRWPSDENCCDSHRGRLTDRATSPPTPPTSTAERRRTATSSGVIETYERSRQRFSSIPRRARSSTFTGVRMAERNECRSASRPAKCGQPTHTVGQKYTITECGEPADGRLLPKLDLRDSSVRQYQSRR